MNHIQGLASSLCKSLTSNSAARELNEKLESLKNSKVKLVKVKEDVEAKVRHEEEQQMVRTVTVDLWLHEVRTMERLVDETLKQAEEEIEKKPGSCFPCFSGSVNVTAKVNQKLQDVNRLITEGNFKVVAQRKVWDPVEEIPVESTVGLDSTFDIVWKCVEDSSVGIIAIHGVGGVGKTTLLKKIRNELVKRSHDFALVIWVELAKEEEKEKVHEKVQEVIRERLEIPADDKWAAKNAEGKAMEIFRLMCKIQFILLFDNLWQKIDLPRIGVPLPDDQNGCKLVFTTRSVVVCGEMEAHRLVNVEPLGSAEAMELFNKNVGEYTLNCHPDIPKMAETFARKCKGLPLALSTVGRAMAGRNDPRDWETSGKLFDQNSPSQLPGMFDVLDLLRFSYDKLQNETLKSCFLFCSIFPENSDIKKDELIELWYAEGLLHESDDKHAARNQGEHIIASLKLVSLLEDGELTGCIRMRGIIREMAIWIVSERGQKNNHLVLDSSNSASSLTSRVWQQVKRASFWGCTQDDIPEAPNCANMKTLLLRDTSVATFPSRFFQRMPVIRALDLSGNQCLAELPAEIGLLGTLQYLNLSLTGIKKLPLEIQYLKNLKCLLLDYTSYLEEVPTEVISSLVSLETYSRIHGVMEYFDRNIAFSANEVSFLKAVGELPMLKEINITIFTPSFVQVFFMFENLRKCLRKLTVMECPDLNILRLDGPYIGHQLVRLEIFNCNSLRTMVAADRFHNLRQVYVSVCSKLTHMTWLTCAPHLETLSILDCNSLEEIIGYEQGQENAVLFSKLITMSLIRLPRFLCICQRPLLLPSLVEIEVSQCPKLKMLPFDSKSARKNLKRIKGEASWWEELYWMDEAVRDYSYSKFVSTAGTSKKMKKNCCSEAGPSGTKQDEEEEC